MRTFSVPFTDFFVRCIRAVFTGFFFGCLSLTTVTLLIATGVCGIVSLVPRLIYLVVPALAAVSWKHTHHYSIWADIKGLDFSTLLLLLGVWVTIAALCSISLIFLTYTILGVFVGALTGLLLIVKEPAKNSPKSPSS